MIFFSWTLVHLQCYPVFRISSASEQLRNHSLCIWPDLFRETDGELIFSKYYIAVFSVFHKFQAKLIKPVPFNYFKLKSNNSFCCLSFLGNFHTYGDIIECFWRTALLKLCSALVVSERCYHNKEYDNFYSLKCLLRAMIKCSIVSHASQYT